MVNDTHMYKNSQFLYIPVYERPATLSKNSIDVNFTLSPINIAAQHAADNILHCSAS